VSRGPPRAARGDPGCGCGNEERLESLFDVAVDPCAPPRSDGDAAFSFADAAFSFADAAFSFADAVRLLYAGACPRQTGVDASVFDPLRVSVVRGRVVSEDGAPLAGVRITVPRDVHPLPRRRG